MCVKISYCNKTPDNSVYAIGGDDAWGGKWGLTVAEAVAHIETGTWAFFVEKPAGDRVEVMIAQRDGRKYVKTVTDGDEPNNLLALPARDPVLTGQSPLFPANVSGARAPRLEGVLRPGNPPTLATIAGRSEFRGYSVFPGSVFIRFSAPWPANLEVRMVDDAGMSPPFEESVSGTASRPDLDALDLGWYQVTNLTNLSRDATSWEILVVPPLSKRRGPRKTVTIAQISINPNCIGGEKKSSPLAVRLERGVSRRNLNHLSGGDRTALCTLISTFLTDAVVAAHTQITHQGAHLLTAHRTYIERLERFLIANNGRRFVPLPKWDPAEPIPQEFRVVRPLDAGGMGNRQPLQNFDPQLPLPAQFTRPALCNIANTEDLGNAINAWHGSIHLRVGGTMADSDVSSAAPIFWCWHAFVDDVFFEWERCP